MLLEIGDRVTLKDKYKTEPHFGQIGTVIGFGTVDLSVLDQGDLHFTSVKFDNEEFAFSVMTFALKRVKKASRMKSSLPKQDLSVIKWLEK